MLKMSEKVYSQIVQLVKQAFDLARSVGQGRTA